MRSNACPLDALATFNDFKDAMLAGGGHRLLLCMRQMLPLFHLSLHGKTQVCPGGRHYHAGSRTYRGGGRSPALESSRLFYRKRGKAASRLRSLREASEFGCQEGGRHSNLTLELINKVMQMKAAVAPLSANIDDQLCIHAHTGQHSKDAKKADPPAPSAALIALSNNFFFLNRFQV